MELCKSSAVRSQTWPQGYVFVFERHVLRNSVYVHNKEQLIHSQCFTQVALLWPVFWSAVHTHFSTTVWMPFLDTGSVLRQKHHGSLSVPTLSITIVRARQTGRMEVQLKVTQSEPTHFLLTCYGEKYARWSEKYSVAQSVRLHSHSHDWQPNLLRSNNNL